MTTLTTSFNQSTAHQRDKKFLILLTAMMGLGIMTTVAGYILSSNLLTREKQKIFNRDAEKIQQLVEERMLAHVNTLRSLQALWNSHNDLVKQKEFGLFLNTLNVFYDYPGISSIGFAKRVGDQLPTTYIEPLAGRENTLGYDNAADPIRKPFFDLARDAGEIVSSAPLTLITTKRPGFFLIAPLYQTGEPPRSLSERQKQLTGFIVMVFRETELFKAIFGRENPLPDLDFAIYHQNILDPDHLLFDSDPEFDPAAYTQKLQTNKYVTVGQSPWTIIVNAKPSFGLTKAEENLPLTMLAVGLTLCGIFGLILLFFFRQHLKKWH